MKKVILTLAGIVAGCSSVEPIVPERPEAALPAPVLSMQQKNEVILPDPVQPVLFYETKQDFETVDIEGRDIRVYQPVYVSHNGTTRIEATVWNKDMFIGHKVILTHHKVGDGDERTLVIEGNKGLDTIDEDRRYVYSFCSTGMGKESLIIDGVDKTQDSELTGFARYHIRNFTQVLNLWEYAHRTERCSQ
ncbi:MAG: hypothetical protein Q7R96_06685 [Nanoarchaeota archaeon]|nr:hypothetical protein [Nanoarchaeota archaeon]